jgi:uncharacterized protein (TIGR04255 family)
VSTPRENAPLVELIAELRWNPDGAVQMPTGTGPIGPGLISQTNAVDSFFMRFGGEVLPHSHQEMERLTPPGMPFFVHQPVYRFKHSEEGQTKTLYQIGPGLFSANAVPPYQSWEKFEPVVQNGVEALLKSRSPTEAKSPFTGINLRYIDAFGPTHTEGREVEQFLREVLGIGISVPQALLRHKRADTAIKPMVQLQIPMQGGLIMSFSVGEGMVNAQQTILMDASIATTLPVEATVESVMSKFSEAHKAISDSFWEMMAPIKHLMPEKKEAST